MLAGHKISFQIFSILLLSLLPRFVFVDGSTDIDLMASSSSFPSPSGWNRERCTPTPGESSIWCTSSWCWPIGSAASTSSYPSRKDSSPTGPTHIRKAISARWPGNTSAPSTGQRSPWPPSAICPPRRPTQSEFPTPQHWTCSLFNLRIYLSLSHFYIRQSSKESNILKSFESPKPEKVCVSFLLNSKWMNTLPKSIRSNVGYLISTSSSFWWSRVNLNLELCYHILCDSLWRKW